MKKERSSKGFTLVELVIVISVIAILAAVLIPTFVSVINKSHQTSAEMEGKQLRAQIIAVFEDFDIFCEQHSGKDGTVTITETDGIDAELNENNLHVGDTHITLYKLADGADGKNILITEIKDKEEKSTGKYQLQYITKSGYTVTITADNDVTAEKKTDPLTAEAE